MKSTYNLLLFEFKHAAMAVVVASGFAIGNADALTATATFNLGAVGSGTTINAETVLSPAWITKGTLPVGSTLRSISINARLDTEGGADTYANDLFVYADPGAPPSGGEILQVGGYLNLGNPATYVTWAGGASGALGTTFADTKTANTDFPDSIDLHDAGLYIGNRGLITGAWSGTITVEYDVFQPAAIVAFGPGGAIGDLAGNSAGISWALPPGTDVTALSPTFTLSSGSSDKISGGPATYDFTNPVVYKVTDGATVNTYTVTVTTPSFLQWNVAGGGAWNQTSTNWLAQPAAAPAVFSDGQAVVFDNAAGGTITIASNVSPLSTTVSGTSDYAFTGAAITGGELVVSSPATLSLPAANFTGTAISGSGIVSMGLAGADFQPGYNMSTFTGTLNLSGGAKVALYDAGFIDPINGKIRVEGTTGLYLGWQGFTYDTTLLLASATNGENLGVLRGDTATLNGAVVLETDTTIGSSGIFTINAVISDDGAGYGFSKIGDGGTVILTANNTYTGTTTVAKGTLQIDSPDALGGGDLIISGGKANLNYTGTKAIVSLTIAGVEQTLPGTYGSSSSGADFQSTSFTGTGTVTIGDPSVAAYISSFGANIPGSTTLISPVVSNAATITWFVPSGTDLATLAPAFALSTGATCTNQTSEVIPSPGFDAGPVAYTVVSSNSAVTNTYTVTTQIVDYLQWNIAGNGNWDTAAPNWLSQPLGVPTAFGNGTKVVFDNAAGGTITVVDDVSPLSTTVSGSSAYAFTGGPIIGGELIVSSPATLSLPVDNFTGAAISGSGTVTMDVANDNEQALNYDMGAFTGTLNLGGGGKVSVNPYFSPDLVSPVNGRIRLQGGTAMYLGWQELVLDTTIILATPTYYEGSGVLRGDTATMNGAVILETNSEIGSEGGGGIFTINAVISDGGAGFGFTKVADGTVILTGSNTYTGTTTVAKGTLQIDSPSALGGGALILSGGTANLNYMGTKGVASLNIGGVEKTLPGTYGSSASAAAYQDPAFLGSGTVTLGPVSVSAYATWAQGPFLGVLTDSTPTLDFDGGSLATGIEWAVGGDPTNPSDDAGLMPTGTIDPTGTYLVFMYQRSDAANADPNTTIKVEYDTDLQGTWTNASGAPGVIITPTDHGATDTVEVKIPMSLASPGKKLFARLSVAVTNP